MSAAWRIFPVERCWMSLTLWIAIAASASYSASGNDFEREFLEKAPREWSQIARKIQRGFNYRIDGISIKLSGDNFVSISETKVFGQNRHYGFELTRNVEQKAWFLTDLHDFSESAVHRLDRLLPTFATNYRDRFFMFGNNFSLAKYITDERLIVTEAMEGDFHGVPCIELSFRFDEKLEPDYEGGYSLEFPPQGRFWVDPTRQWALLGWEWWMPDSDVVISGRNLDFKETDNVFLPSRQHFKRENRKTGEVLEDRQFVIQVVQVGKRIPSSEFRLPHFGLPELPRVEKIGHNRWLLAITLGVGIVLLVFLASFSGTERGKGGKRLRAIPVLR